MPGTLLHLGATVQCAHVGRATPTAPNPRVTVAGQQTVIQTAPYAVAGCTLPPNAGGPCVTAQWVTAALRVKSLGTPLLLLDSQAVCSPTGAPLLVLATQPRVSAT